MHHVQVPTHTRSSFIAAVLIGEWLTAHIKTQELQLVGDPLRKGVSECEQTSRGTSMWENCPFREEKLRDIDRYRDQENIFDVHLYH